MRKSFVAGALAVVVMIGIVACGKAGSDAPFASPEATFETVKNAILNRDTDRLWDSLSGSWQAIFEKGRQELVAQPAEDKAKIAEEGRVTVADIEKMSTKDFFKLYFNTKKREAFKTNAPEILEKKIDTIRESSIVAVEYDGGDKAKAVKATLTYKLGADEYKLDMVKVGDLWLMTATK